MWDKSQPGNLVGNSLVGTCLTLPNLGFLWVFFKYPKISNNGNLLFFPVNWTTQVALEGLTIFHIQSLFVSGEEDISPPRRLTHSIQEPNVAKGYIKEHCFNHDGRIICSPFGNSARILSFSPECDELSSCVHSTPSELCDLKTLISHKQAVVTCRFSPTHSLLSLGCLGGKVSFYQPKL